MAGDRYELLAQSIETMRELHEKDEDRRDDQMTRILGGQERMIVQLDTLMEGNIGIRERLIGVEHDVGEIKTNVKTLDRRVESCEQFPAELNRSVWFAVGKVSGALGVVALIAIGFIQLVWK